MILITGDARSGEGHRRRAGGVFVYLATAKRGQAVGISSGKIEWKLCELLYTCPSYPGTPEIGGAPGFTKGSEIHRRVPW